MAEIITQYSDGMRHRVVTDKNGALILDVMTPPPPLKKDKDQETGSDSDGDYMLITRGAYRHLHKR